MIIFVSNSLLLCNLLLIFYLNSSVPHKLTYMLIDNCDILCILHCDHIIKVVVVLLSFTMSIIFKSVYWCLLVCICAYHLIPGLHQ